MTDAKKFYSVTEEIEGVKYRAQFNGLSAALRSTDESYLPGSNNISVEAINDYILKNVIVDPPGLTIDDFDNMDTLNKVAKFGMDVMQGRFRDKKDKAAK